MLKNMNKYLLVIKNTWQEFFTYRVTFLMWRIRTILMLLAVYYLWLAVLPSGTILFGYNQSLILTYVLGTTIVGSFVFSSQTDRIGENINSGDLSTFLIRPLKYFTYWFSRDIGHKVLNVIFSFIEVFILYLILKPPLFIQNNLIIIFSVVTAILLAIVLNFFISSILGLIAFWSPEVWAPRFIVYILIQFLSGMFFPIDILPSIFRTILELSPIPYLAYFPLKIYLGQLSIQQIIQGLIIMSFWVLIFFIFRNFIWNKGLKEYTAQGR